MAATARSITRLPNSLRPGLRREPRGVESRQPQKKRASLFSEALGNGGYLLSHKCSTIGDAELNDPVRNGKGWDLSAITT